MLEVCALGVVKHGFGVQGPCPSLVKDGNQYRCEIILHEQDHIDEHGGHPIVGETLGIGVYCDSEDGDRSEAVAWHADVRMGKFNIREKKNAKNV